MDFFISSDSRDYQEKRKNCKSTSTRSMRQNENKEGNKEEFSTFRIDFDSNKMATYEKSTDSSRTHSVMDKIVRSLFNKKEKKGSNSRQREILDRREPVINIRTESGSMRNHPPSIAIDSFANERISDYERTFNYSLIKAQEPEEVTDTPRGVEKAIEKSIYSIGVNKMPPNCGGIKGTSGHNNKIFSPLTSKVSQSVNFMNELKLDNFGSKQNEGRYTRDLSPLDGIKRTGDTFYFEYEEISAKGKNDTVMINTLQNQSHQGDTVIVDEEVEINKLKTNNCWNLSSRRIGKIKSDGAVVKNEPISKAFPFRESHNSGLLNIKVYKDVIKYLDIQSLLSMKYVSKKLLQEEFKKIFRATVITLLKRGLNPLEQYNYWDHYVKFAKLKSQFKDKYIKNTMLCSEYDSDIKLDIDRTFSSHDKLSQPSEQRKLTRLLVAISHSIKDVGYIQGLNAFVGVFLLNSLFEEEIYWISKYFLNKMQVKEIMKADFPKLLLLNYQLEIYMSNYMSDILEHLGKEGIPLTYFTAQWFLPLFAYDLPLQTLNKIWNIFLIKGWKTVMRFALALLNINKVEILKRNCDELGDYLKHIQENFDTKNKESELIELALNYKVTNRLMKSLEFLYEIAAPPKLMLSKLESGKSEWKIIESEPGSGKASKINNKNILEYTNELAEKSNLALNKKRSDLAKCPPSPRNTSVSRGGGRNQSISVNFLDQISHKIKGLFGSSTPISRSQKNSHDGSPSFFNGDEDQETNASELSSNILNQNEDQTGNRRNLGSNRPSSWNNTTPIRELGRGSKPQDKYPETLETKFKFSTIVNDRACEDNTNRHIFNKKSPRYNNSVSPYLQKAVMNKERSSSSAYILKENISNTKYSDY